VKIADASSARIWRIERMQPRAGSAATQESKMYRKVSDRLAAMYVTVTPADTGYYAAGRNQIESYSRSFVDIREFSYHHSVGLRNARMTDAEIEALIERMNLSHR